VGTALLWLGKLLFVWPWVALWRYVAVPAGTGLARLARVLVVVPAKWLYRNALTPLGHALAMGFGWLYRRLLTPSGHGIAWLLRGIGTVVAAVGLGAYTAVVWLMRYLFVVPARWLYAWVLTPLGQGTVWLVRSLVAGVGFVLYWTTRVLFVLPALAVWRWVLVPVGRVLMVVGREAGEALGHAWRVAGYVSLAVGRFLARLFRWMFVAPVVWMYRTVLTPLGHVVRDVLWRPTAAVLRGAGRLARQTAAAVRDTTRQALSAARDSVRQARADFRRMLFGTPEQPEPVALTKPGADSGRSR